MAAYPTVEAAEEVSEEETADALESDEPSDEEEAATEEESDSEDIDEAGEEEDLSISDATEEDEEVVEEIEEEEVVEETEEADAEDPSFSDSEDTSDTTETEAVEEEAEEEEEEVVEEETEEEEEASESEEQVVEAEAEAEELNTGVWSLEGSTIALGEGYDISNLYAGDTDVPVVITLVAKKGDIVTDPGKIKVEFTSNNTNVTEGPVDIGKSEPGEWWNGTNKTITRTMSLLKPGGTQITAQVSIWDADAESDAEASATYDLTLDDGGNDLTVKDVINGQVALGDAITMALGDKGRTVAASVPVAKEGNASYVEFQYYWDNASGSPFATYYATSAKDVDEGEGKEYVSPDVTLAPETEGDHSLIVRARAYKSDLSGTGLTTAINTANNTAADTIQGDGSRFELSKFFSGNVDVTVKNPIKSVVVDETLAAKNLIVWNGQTKTGQTTSEFKATVTMETTGANAADLFETEKFKLGLATKEDESTYTLLDQTKVTLVEKSGGTLITSGTNAGEYIIEGVITADGADVTTDLEDMYLAVIPQSSATETIGNKYAYSTNTKKIAIYDNILEESGSTLSMDSGLSGANTISANGEADLTAEIAVKNNSVAGTLKSVPKSVYVKFDISNLGTGVSFGPKGGFVKAVPVLNGSGDITKYTASTTVVADGATAVTGKTITATAQGYSETALDDEEAGEGKEFGLPVTATATGAAVVNDAAIESISFSGVPDSLYIMPSNPSEEAGTTITGTIKLKDALDSTQNNANIILVGLTHKSDTNTTLAMKVNEEDAFTALPKSSGTAVYVKAVEDTSDNSHKTYKVEVPIAGLAGSSEAQDGITFKVYKEAHNATAPSNAGAPLLTKSTKEIKTKINPVSSVAITMPDMAAGMDPQSAKATITMGSGYNSEKVSKAKIDWTLTSSVENAVGFDTLGTLEKTTHTSTWSGGSIVGTIPIKMASSLTADSTITLNAVVTAYDEGEEEYTGSYSVTLASPKSKTMKAANTGLKSISIVPDEETLSTLYTGGGRLALDVSVVVPAGVSMDGRAIQITPTWTDTDGTAAGNQFYSEIDGTTNATDFVLTSEDLVSGSASTDRTYNKVIYMSPGTTAATGYLTVLAKLGTWSSSTWTTLSLNSVSAKTGAITIQGNPISMITVTNPASNTLLVNGDAKDIKATITIGGDYEFVGQAEDGTANQGTDESKADISKIVVTFKSNAKTVNDKKEPYMEFAPETFTITKKTKADGTVDATPANNTDLVALSTAAGKLAAASGVAKIRAYAQAFDADGDPIDDGKTSGVNATGITITQNYLDKVSLEVNPEYKAEDAIAYVGGQDVTLTAYAQGVDSTVLGSDKAVYGTFTLGANTEAKFVDSEGNLVSASNVKVKASEYVAGKGWKITATLRGVKAHAAAGSTTLDVNAKVYASDGTDNVNPTSDAEYQNGTVSIKQKTVKVGKATSVEISNATDFQSTNSIYTGGKKTLNSVVSIYGKAESDTTKWNYVELTYTSTNDAVSFTDDRIASYTKYISKSSFSNVGGSSDEATKDESVVVYGRTIGSTDSINVKARLVKLTNDQIEELSSEGVLSENADAVEAGQYVVQSASDTESETAGTIANVNVVAALEVSSMSISQNNGAFKNIKASTAGTVVSGSDATIQVQLKNASPSTSGIKRVEVNWEYGTPGSNLVFGDLAEGSATVTGATGVNITAELDVPVIATTAVSNTIVATIHAYDSLSDGNEIALGNLTATSGTITVESALSEIKVESDKATMNVGDTATITTTVTPAEDAKIDHVKLEWPADTTEFEFTDFEDGESRIVTAELVNGKYVSTTKVKAKAVAVNATFAVIPTAYGLKSAVDGTTTALLSTIEAGSTTPLSVNISAGALENAIVNAAATAPEAAAKLMDTTTSATGVATDYTLWVGNANTKLTGQVSKPASWTGSIDHVTMKYSWVGDEDSKGSVEFSKSDSTNAGDWASEQTITTTGTSPYSGDVWIRGVGGKATGKILVESTAYNASNSPLSATLSSKTCNIKVFENPVLSGGDITVEPAAVPYGATADVKWILKAPNAPTEDTDLKAIKVDFANATTGNMFTLNTTSVDLNSTSALSEAYNATLGGYEIKTTITMRSKANVVATSGKITATAQAYKNTSASAGQELGYQTSSETTTAITAKEGTIKTVTLANAPNIGELYMGGVSTSKPAAIKTTATVTTSGTDYLTNKYKVAFSWEKDSGSVDGAVELSGGEKSGNEYIVPLTFTGNTATSGTASITLKSVKAGSGRLVARAFVDESGSTDTMSKTGDMITVHDYLDSMTLRSDKNEKQMSELTATEQVTMTATVNLGDYNIAQAADPAYRAVVIDWAVVNANNQIDTSNSITTTGGVWQDSKNVTNLSGNQITFSRTFTMDKANSTGLKIRATANVYNVLSGFSSTTPVANSTAIVKTSDVIKIAANNISATFKNTNTERLEVGADYDKPNLETVVSASSADKAKIKALKIELSGTATSGTGTLQFKETKDDTASTTWTKTYKGESLEEFWSAGGVQTNIFNVATHGWTGTLKSKITAYSDDTTLTSDTRLGVAVEKTIEKLKVKGDRKMVISETYNDNSDKIGEDFAYNVIGKRTNTFKLDSANSSNTNLFIVADNTLSASAIGNGSFEYTAGSSLTKTSTDANGTEGVFTTAEVSSLTETNVTVKSVETADYYEDTATVKLNIYPELLDSELVLSPSESTVDTGSEQELTLSTSNLKAVLGNAAETNNSVSAVTVNDANIHWTVEKVNAANDSAAGTNAADIASIKTIKDEAKVEVSIKENPTTAYNGWLRVTAALQGQKKAGAPAQTGKKTAYIKVNTLLSGTEFGTGYNSGKSVKVNEVSYWGPTTATGSEVLPVVPLPTGISGVTYSVRATVPTVAEVSMTEAKNADNETVQTGGITVKGLSEGTTGIEVTVSKGNVTKKRNITLTVEKNAMALNLSTETANNYVGGTLNLADEVVNKAATTITKNGSTYNKTGVSFSYALKADSDVLTLDGNSAAGVSSTSGVIIGKKTGQAVVVVSADCGADGIATAEVKVNILETLDESKITFSPAEWTIGNSALNTKLISVVPGVSAGTITYSWSIPTEYATKIGWSSPTTDVTAASPTIKVLEAFTDGLEHTIPVTCEVTQTFTNGSVSGIGTFNLKVAKTATISLDSIKLTAESESKGTVEKNNQTIRTTNKSAARTLTATALPVGYDTSSGTWSWGVYESDFTTAVASSKVVSLGTGTGDDVTVSSIVKAQSTNTIRGIGVGTAYVKAVFTPTGGTGAKEARFTVEVSEAAGVPVISIPDPESTTIPKAALTKAYVGKTYDISATSSGQPLSYWTNKGYTFTKSITNNTYIDEDGVETENYYLTDTIGNDGSGTISALNYNRAGVEISYSLSINNEDGDPEWTATSELKKLPIDNVALTSLDFDTNAAKALNVGESRTISSILNDGATGVEYSWVLKENNSDVGKAGNFIQIDSKKLTEATLDISAVAATGSNTAVLELTATQDSIAAGSDDNFKVTITKTLDITVDSPNIPIQKIGIKVDGKLVADGVSSITRNYLSNDASTSTMELEGVITPGTATGASVQWSMSNTNKIHFQGSDSNFATGNKVVIVPVDGAIGDQTVMATGFDADGKMVVASVVITVKKVSLQGVNVYVKGYEDQSAIVSSDTIMSGDTTVLSAMASPKTAVYDHINWSIDKDSATKAVKFGSSTASTSETATGDYVSVVGMFAGMTTIRAEIFENANDAEPAGTNTFNVTVSDSEIQPSALFIEDDSYELKVGKEESSTDVVVRYWPTGAQVSDIKFNDDSTNVVFGTASTLETSTGAKAVKSAMKAGNTAGDFTPSISGTGVTNIVVGSTGYSASSHILNVKVTTDMAKEIGDIMINGDKDLVGTYNGERYAIVPANSNIAIEGVGIYNGTTEASDKRVKWTITSVSAGTIPAITYTEDKDGLETGEAKFTTTAAGTTMTLQGQTENGSGITRTLSLLVTPELKGADLEISGISEKVYNGTAQTQDQIKIAYRGKELLATDYALAYTNNTDAGNATVTIGNGTSGRVTFASGIEENFIIKKASVANMTPVLSGNFTYNGKAQKPSVKSITGAIGTMKEGTDYKVVYSNANSTNAGSYTVSIEGTGTNFEGKSKTATYTIAKANSSFTAGNITLTGAKPATISVKNGNGVKSYTYALTSGKSYVTLSGNKLTGKLVGKNKAKVRVTGVGDANHNNSVKDITITVNKPAKVTNVKPTTTKKHIVQAKWKKSTSATGYVVQLSISKKFTKKTTKTVTVKKASTVKYNFKKCTKGKRYYTRVYAYVGNNKTANRSAVSAKKNVVCK